MTDRPIIFSAPMVRAILGGGKTQTRRIIKPQPFSDGYFEGLLSLDRVWKDGEARFSATSVGGGAICECIVPTRCALGDRLWVREAFSYSWVVRDDPDRRHLMPVWYWADGNPESGSWSKPKPSIHMPRWASRITLEVKSVEVERLHDITAEDAIAEGLAAITKDGKLMKYGIPDRDGLPGGDDDGWPWHQWKVDPRLAYADLWNRINGPQAWEANPWVVVVTFERVTP